MVPARPPRAAAARVVTIALSTALAATSMGAVARASITSPFTPSTTIELAPGITYQQGVMRTSGDRRQSVRVATVDPGHPDVKLRALLSNDRVVWRERVSHIARRKSVPGMQAMVATNGDMSKARAVNAYAAPHGTHIAGREVWVAQACAWPTLGIDAAGNARIDAVRVHLEVMVPGHAKPRPILRVNTHRDDGAVVMFTHRFAASTRTRAGGIEAVVAMSDRLRPVGTQTLRVLKVRRGGGDTRIRKGQAVLSVKNGKSGWMRGLRKGQRLQLTSRIVHRGSRRCSRNAPTASGWDDVVEALGGNYFTARYGQLAAPSAATYPSGSQRHPRTGIGLTPDGRVLMVTVDGRRSGYSVGVTLAEMGQLMLSLGAQHSFNGDGGGSTVMARRFPWSGAFKVANRPSDGRERPATHALTAFSLTP